MSVGALATAAVDVIANLDTFEPDLKRKLEGAIRSVSKSIVKDFDKLGAKAGKAFSDAASKVAESSASFDQVGQAAERMERTASHAAREMSSSFKVPLNDVQKLERAVQEASDSQADALGKVRVAETQLKEAREKSGKASSAAIAAEERLAAAQRNQIRVSRNLLDATESLVTAREATFRNAGEIAGEAAGDGFGNGFRRTARDGADGGGRDAGNFFARAFETAASRAIGSALLKTFAAGTVALITAISPLSTLLGGATAAVVALASALASAAPAAISLGGVLGALGLAAAALKVGFSGVGDALKEQSKAQEELARTGEISKATQERLDAALKGLAPSAAAVVKQLGAMAPAWQAVTRSVQERLFTGVATALANLGNRFLPVLTAQLGAAATTLNQFAQGFARFFNTSTRASQISGILTSLNGILRTLLGPATALAGAFLNVFQASLPFAQQLANVLSTLSQNFAGFLNQAVSSGAFTQFMQTAMTLAGQLFQLLGNIGSILGSVFAAGTAAGGNLLTILRDVTGQFAQFLKSAAGQEALASFFGLISRAAQVVVGVFRTLQPLLAGIGNLFDALGPALDSLGSTLAGVFGNLAKTLGSTFTQLAPLIATFVSRLTPLANALGSILGAAITGLTPIIGALVQGLTALAPGLAAVATVISGVLTQAFQVLGPLISQLLVTLGQLLGGFLQGFAPVLQVLATAALQLIAPIAQMAQAFLTMIQALIPLLPALGQLNAVVLQLVLAFLPLVTTILQLFADQATKIAPAIAQAVPLLAQLIALLTRIAQAILPVVAGFVSFLSTIIQVFAQADIAILGFVVRAIGSFTGFVARMIAAAVRLGAGIVNAIASMVARVTGFFNTLVGTVAGAIARFALAVKAGIDRAVAFFAALPGRVSAAISGLSSALFAAGSQAVSGLVNGIKSKAGEVLAAAQDLAGKVKAGIGGALKIFSPSRVTHEQGEFAGQGLANGLRSQLKAVSAAATNLANAVPAAISGSLGKLDTQLRKLPPIVQKAVATATATTRAGIAATAKASDVLDAKLKTSQSNLQALLQKSQELAKSVAQSILQTGNITQGQDQSFAGIVGRLKDAVTNAREFNTVLARLTAAGLNKASLQQIIDAGAETGTAAGKAVLAAGKAGVQQINSLQQQLQAAANRAAKTASDAIFGQGLQIANGIVTGLQRQRTALNAQMLRLGDVLAARVVAVLRSVRANGAAALTVPGFARGTIVDKPTLGMIGEGRSKEAVIPLDGSQRSADLMDQSGLTKLALERALGNQPTPESGRVREINMPVTVAGLTKEETVQIFREFLANVFGPRLGISTAEGAV